MKSKLSEAQKNVITEMRNGVILHYLGGIDARCFMARTGKTVSWATVFKLEDLKLIVRTDGKATLTELGKTIEL